MLVTALIAALILNLVLAAMLYRQASRVRRAEAEVVSYHTLLVQSEEALQALRAKFKFLRTTNVGLVNSVRALCLNRIEAKINPPKLTKEQYEQKDELLAVEKRIVQSLMNQSMPKRVVQARDAEFRKLWNLELKRSERMWKSHVAINPLYDTSPFIDADNLAQLCVEVEAAALREELGLNITVRWSAGVIVDVAKALTVVRAAQETMAEAAQQAEFDYILEVGEMPDVQIKLSQVEVLDLRDSAAVETEALI